MNTTVLIGATSAMAEAAGRHLAADGEVLYLAGRDRTRLNVLREDFLTRGAEEVHLLPTFDAADPESLTELCRKLTEIDLDRVLVAFGTLPDPEDCEADPDAAARSLRINLESVIRVCTPIANRMEQQESGILAVISSVAGLRGRQSNYHYGSSKGGVNVFLQGLRNRLQPHRARVLTILPGFVDTPMTAHLDQGPLFISAEAAGRQIYKAMTTGKSDILYVPGFWQWIMLVIRLIPEPVFKRLKL